MYQIIDDGENMKLKALADGAMFPLDDREPRYADYLKWLREGNAPEVVHMDIALADARLAKLDPLALDIMFAQENKIRALQQLPPLADVAAYRAELKRTVPVVADAVVEEAEPAQ